MARLFISHSSSDDAFVRDLRAALADHGHQGWIDSRELRGGDPLWSEIQAGIEAASAFAVVVSPDALQSKWVGKELRHALTVQAARGRDAFPVFALSLDGTKLGVLEALFGEEPVYIPVCSGAGGVEAAMDAVLVALGERLPDDVPGAPQPPPEPLEELVLELTDLRMAERDGVQRASARARLVYHPATKGQREVASAETWRLHAPIGPIEAEELRWYLEKYAVWPSGYFRDRARKVEKSLAEWGRLLHDQAMPPAHTANVAQAWAKVGGEAGRRFSVQVDPAVEAGAPETEVAAAREAATLLLGLPWELMHDGDAYLFQGARPTRVRRRLPNTRVLDVPVVAPPIRILLVTARPEDEACGYIDHRASALPLVEAMESLPGLVDLHLLDPPTLPALREELDRARRAGRPFHVVHFDGHGVYDRRVGLGGLCFERPEDTGKLEKRRHVTVYTEDRAGGGTGLGSLLREHRIPLVVLEACQSGAAEQASESVASELLKGGVASVVAMSHSVLVETARRFVEAFYRALAEGRRVGDAMLEGQRTLQGDTFRGRVFGAGELRLEDWFVPVLYQERDDPQLFLAAPSRQSVEDFRAALAVRISDLPSVPETGFVGRSRELLALQRLLRPVSGGRYAVVRGQGGEGKTTLAAELARWMVRSHQVRRAAFVTVEGLEANIAEVMLDRLGAQLVKPGFSTQADCGGEVEVAAQKVERALREQPTLLVVDNVESILLPPYLAAETPEALAEAAAEELEAVLALCARLLKAGDTRLVFTSREALPAPFDAAGNEIELRRLGREDAVKLVERVLNAAGGAGAADDAAREGIEALVEAVHGHARTLALLAPSLRARGVEATRASLVELMAEMERRFPGSREQSVFASVELSLRRLSAANRERVRVLGVFHGGVQLGVLQQMMEWDQSDVAALARELIGTGLATLGPHGHLTPNPSLPHYLRPTLDAAERETLTAGWIGAMRTYVEYLRNEQSQNTEIAATLTVLELPNLSALLDLVQQAGDTEATIGLTTSLHQLLLPVGQRRLLERVGSVRDAAGALVGSSWSHERFEAAAIRVEQQIDGGQVREALEGTMQLLEQARTVGEGTYAAGEYQLALACLLRARALHMADASDEAVKLLDEARRRFDVCAEERSGGNAERMASVCTSEIGNCLLELGRFDDSAAAYELSIRQGRLRGDVRQVAIAKFHLGTVRMHQRRHAEALTAYDEARELFTRLNERKSVAGIWYQTGRAYELAGQAEAAEEAFRNSLAMRVQLRDLAGVADTLGELAVLYAGHLNRTEEAVAFFRMALEKYEEIGDAAGETRQRNNLANTLRALRRYDEARQEISRAIESKAQLGYAASPWKSWGILSDIETDAGNPAAGTAAKREATARYLAYRRDGGENQYLDGRIALAVLQALAAGDAASVTAALQRLTANSQADASKQVYIRALQAIVAGSRDRALADAPELDYTMAAEILFLIETLEQAEGRPPSG
jgi:tetratricopeptide (TPR) repeat protein